MYGLYDTDGILRYVCGDDRDACIAYAELFNLESVECSLMDLPEPNSISLKGQKKNQVMSNS